MDLEPLADAVAEVHQLHPALDHLGARDGEQRLHVPQQRRGHVVFGVDHAHHVAGADRQCPVQLLRLRRPVVATHDNVDARMTARRLPRRSDRGSVVIAQRDNDLHERVILLGQPVERRPYHRCLVPGWHDHRETQACRRRIDRLRPGQLPGGSWCRHT